MALEANNMKLPPVIAAYQQWIAKCLIADGSLFSSANLWTPELVEEVRAAFVDHPDMGGDSFWQKLKKQMQNASPAAKHLMAEMIWAMLTFTSNINANTKRNGIREVWAYSGQVLSEKLPLLNDEVLSGIGSGGQGYLTGYWRELTFIIKLTVDLKTRSQSERQKILTTYDDFVVWIAKLPEGDTRQFRHMLRYVAFPDRVERIASNNHRQEILDRFGVASEKETRNWSDQRLDEALLKLRSDLQKDYPGQILDFYESPLKARWRPDGEPPTSPLTLKESATTMPDLANPQRRYWTLSAGEGGEMWEDFYQNGIAAIGWDDLGDLTKFKDKEEIRQKLQELWPGDSSQKNNAHACWQFAQEIQVGDIMFAKQGFSKLFGYGVVESDYHFDDSRPNYQHTHKVKWYSKGEWEMPEDGKMAMKTLTDITRWPDFIKKIGGKVGLEIGVELNPVDKPALSDAVAYWWLNANPKIWDFRTASIGSVQTYTSHNEAGNKRQKFKYFAAVKPGDLLIGYVTTPDKEIVAICEITKALHGPPGKEAIEFRKIEQFSEPVTWAELQAVPALSKCEPILNNQGSLFSVTEDEYEAIRALIDERNLGTKLPKPASFTKADALAGLFMSADKHDEIIARLKRKKALILQGPPGVGKTFVARRLAFAMMGMKDVRRVAMVQFHPSYGYEDFVQGFRPTRTGLERRDGVFYQFVRLVRNDPDRDWFFIIDEINRGNLAKIFGELLMLIEADKRGPEHAIPLVVPAAPVTSVGSAIPITNIYYLLCYAWDVLEEKDALADVNTLDSTDLIDLFARVLVNGTRRLLRRGLDRGYLPREDEILGVRGKLLVTQTLRHNLLRHGRAACAWDELEYDTLPNRILKTTLQRLHDTEELHAATRADVNDLLRWLAPVQGLELHGEHFRRVQLHRNNRIYAFLLHICEFVHEHWLPAEHGGARRFRDFLRDALPKLFQNFVFNFFQRELAGQWQVTNPHIHWHLDEANEDARVLLPRMETDVCLRGDGRAIILDTKFYAEALKAGAYGTPKLSSANLYQIFTYLRQQSCKSGWEQAEGVLLYPRTTQDFAVEFTTHGHRIRALTLDLAQPWQNIHATLLKIVGASKMAG